MLDIEASSATRASAICRRVSGECCDGDAIGGEGWDCEEVLEGSVGDIEGGAVEGAGSAVGGADELEAWVDILNG